MNTVEQDDHPTPAPRPAGSPVTAVVAVTLLGAAPRLFRVWRRPMGFAWDESYYVPAARSYLDGVFDVNLEHPPLGKWLIAAGIQRHRGRAPGLAGGVTGGRHRHRPPGLVPGPPPARLLGLGDGGRASSPSTACSSSRAGPRCSTACSPRSSWGRRWPSWSTSTGARPADAERAPRRRRTAPGRRRGLQVGGPRPPCSGPSASGSSRPVGTGRPCARPRSRSSPSRPPSTWPAHAGPLIQSGFDLPAFFRTQIDAVNYHRKFRVSPRTVQPGVDLALAADPAQLHLGGPWTAGSPTSWPSATRSCGGASSCALPHLVLVWWRRRDRTVETVLFAVLTLYLPWLVILRPGLPLLPHPAGPLHGPRPDLQPPGACGTGAGLSRVVPVGVVGSRVPGLRRLPSASGPSPPSPRSASTGSPPFADWGESAVPPRHPGREEARDQDGDVAPQEKGLGARRCGP